MKRYKCQYPKCKNPEDFRATNDSAEWAHVCKDHLGHTWYPDSWEPVPVEPKASGTTRAR